MDATRRTGPDGACSPGGDEKALPQAWVWARYVDPAISPDATLLPPPGILEQVSPTLYAEEQGHLATEVDAARDALRCPDVTEVLASAQDSLGPGRLVENLWRSVTSFELRIAPRPTDAQDQFC